MRFKLTFEAFRVVPIILHMHTHISNVHIIRFVASIASRTQIKFSGIDKT